MTGQGRERVVRPGESSPESALILVVDDNPDNLDIISTRLRFRGYEVAVAERGDEAISKVRDVDPDLILLDIMMPNVDGWQVAENLKADAATRDIPIVFLTARAMEADVRKGKDLGVEAYVTKPFDPIDLMELVNRLIEERA
jgi:CheY-like chemotaxis protein